MGTWISTFNTRTDERVVAPEVIEQSGATTASDIWSVGCTVIELLEGKPPFHFLDPMPALFRIVQDDCPPIPEGASPVVKDFLYHCFQKDPNLRVSAKKLLRHPWMLASKRQISGQKSSEGPDRRPLSNYNYDEAVLKVQEWNEALKCTLSLSQKSSSINRSLAPSKPSKHPSKRQNNEDGRRSPLQPLDFGPAAIRQLSTTPQLLVASGSAPKVGNLLRVAPTANNKIQPAATPLGHIRETLPMPFILQQPEEQTDNWDDDFEEGISFTKLHGKSPVS